MSYTDFPVSRRRQRGHRITERSLLFRFAFVWISSLLFLALAWYERAPAL